jgi:uncharacterized membrane protein
VNGKQDEINGGLILLAKHAQHVVLIHFLIALFIAAVAFDYLAQWTNNRTLGPRRRISIYR